MTILRNHINRKSQLNPSFGVCIKETDINSYISRFSQATDTVGKLGSDDGKKTALLAYTIL